MTREQLLEAIRRKKSFLCVGLDLDVEKMPSTLAAEPEGWLQFNKSIIDATRDLCVAYKPNWAFYEALGEDGMNVLRNTIAYIGQNHLIIADAKRGDIGNTSNKYSQAIFQEFHADAITVSPYMGNDSLSPFQVSGKWLIILALTSNPGSQDFQRLPLRDGRQLFEEVLRHTSSHFSPEEAMFVVGATHPEDMKKIRQIIPDHFLLVPGVGAQGGSLEQVCRYGLNQDIGLLINSSRSIIYAGGQDDNYEIAIRSSAQDLQNKMKAFL